MTISADEIYLLNNRMGRVANKCQLGTLISNAESVVAAEVALADGSILIGNGSGIAAANAVTGDVTISNSGVTAIGSGVIVNADVNGSAAIAYSKLNLATSILNADVSASAAIAFSKLAALTDGNILVGNGSNVAASVAVTGDVAISNAGLTSLAGFTHTTEGLSKLEKVAVAIYDFGVDGGVQGTIGLGVTLPDNAVVTKVIEDITTHLTSAGSGATFVMGLPTDGALTASVTADGSNVAVASVLPSGTPVKCTAARELTVTIGTEAVTAGAARWFVYYVQSI
jgi:hypothetical protein